MDEDYHALASTGMKHFHKKKYSLAADFFSRAVDGAHEAQNDLDEAKLRNNLSVSYLMDGQAQLALEAVRETDKVFETHNDLKRQAMALGNTGQALEELKEYSQALECYDQAIAILKGKEFHDVRSVLLRRKAMVQGKTGDVYQAVASMDTSKMEITNPDLKDKVFKKILDRIFNRKKA